MNVALAATARRQKPISKNDFLKTLHNCGIRWRCGSDINYQKSKRIADSVCINSGDYERLVKIAVDFIRV